MGGTVLLVFLPAEAASTPLSPKAVPSAWITGLRCAIIPDSVLWVPPAEGKQEEARFTPGEACDRKA